MLRELFLLSGCMITGLMKGSTAHFGECSLREDIIHTCEIFERSASRNAVFWNGGRFSIWDL